MARAHTALATFAALTGVALGHDRRAQAWSGAQEHIWGHCDSQWSLGDKWEGGNKAAEDAFGPNVTSCDLIDAVCSDRLSDGPSDADIEIALGNLPPSTSEEDVHLQWWAPRRSPSTYDALGDVTGCAVYANMADAYPKYWEGDFNGGNVRVNESGVAIIRVRSPASYYIQPYVLWPHLHFRICHGEKSAQFYYDSVAVGQQLAVSTKSQDSAIKVLSASVHHGVVQEAAAEEDNDSSSDIAPIGYLVIKPATAAGEATTTAEASTSSSSSSSSLEVVVTKTTTTQTSGTSTAVQSLKSVLMEEAMSQFKLDALEFSPIYQCLLDELVFNHFSGQCSDQCPQSADLHKGQCVLPADEPQKASFTASWHLEVNCADLCGANMENETLHNIRLSVAGHLDIPFQEVEHTAFAWLAADSRRLSDSRVLFVTIRVNTQRHGKEAGLDRLTTFFDDLHQSSQLLGMPIIKVGAVPENPTPSDLTELTDETDPFAVSYEVLLQDSPTPSTDKSTESNSMLVAFVVAGTVVFGCMIGVLAWMLRQRLRRQHFSDAIVNGKKVEDHNELPEAAKGEQAPEATAEQAPEEAAREQAPAPQPEASAEEQTVAI